MKTKNVEKREFITPLLIRNAYRAMITSLPGGYAEMASALTYTENSLSNRVRDHAGQKVDVGAALEMQIISGRKDFAHAVAQCSEGVFIPLCGVQGVGCDDLGRLSRMIAARLGDIFKKFDNFTEDEILDKKEFKELNDDVYQLNQLMMQFLTAGSELYPDE
ncbi:MULTISPECIES: YmfL family putative regulatory protein [unclassified Gilliamella]|uniref:YmfL family putative regulatory protein n=1 Tax=unclassified Gilliamella TaxID=2685620 RepID=UPI00226AC87F|nr:MULTISPECIES: YmfL family putative regulatory protein [unclassified Gilliamella]MCX8641702.1 hypothetical protein [Gilliamella sp. B3835]MCX8706503.1 hypothetical protein [Gilliamella sp. B3783]MCX8709154.1 hypothetical protein [Gilliamella sp. B3780]MCX8714526.1 hypothetical protein [Gilliamella sp. B3781]MCX8715893.1 hypothetical protein [Gilliamella sp. B3784]